jgi:hypothetical protein
MHGIHAADSSWRYRWTNAARTGARLLSVFEYDVDASTATIKTTDSWTLPAGAASYSSTIYEYVYCAASGLHITSKPANSTTNWEVTEDHVNSSPPFLAMKFQELGGANVYYWAMGFGQVTYPGTAVLETHSSTPAM